MQDSNPCSLRETRCDIELDSPVTEPVKAKNKMMSQIEFLTISASVGFMRVKVMGDIVQCQIFEKFVSGFCPHEISLAVNDMLEFIVLRE